MTFFERMVVFVWTSIVFGLGVQRVRELRDVVTTQGKNITEAIDRQTNRCRPYTPLFP